ncbi:hypothetical protein BS78_09G108500 [Paspalum vaginatum]|nr:hypothetical protein BS78_09G108500 [Paspalum vaginatum]
MATSGSSSSSSRYRGSIGEDGIRKSPIPYRIGPLYYEPPVSCHCRKKAALWISWSDDNPGRRYLKCFRARERGCDFIRWYKGPCAPFVASLLVDLCDTVWSLKRERAELKLTASDSLLRAKVEKKEMRKVMDELARKEVEIMAKDRTVRKLERERLFLCMLSMAVAIVLLRCCVV